MFNAQVFDPFYSFKVQCCIPDMFDTLLLRNGHIYIWAKSIVHFTHTLRMEKVYSLLYKAYNYTTYNNNNNIYLIIIVVRLSICLYKNIVGMLLVHRLLLLSQ